VQPENKMGIMSEHRLLLSVAIPMMFSMLIQALYNIVDSMFVARVSENALTAVSLTFPIQIMMIAVSVGTGIGINALLSRNLGEGDLHMASKAANVGIFLSFVSSLAFTILGLLFSRIYFEAQVDVPEIIQYGHDYMFYICVFSIGMFGQVVFSRLLQSTGKTFHSMMIQLVGALLNIVLDWILIFGHFGLPALGVKGAAIATVIGQTVAMLLGIYLNVKHNPEIKLSLREMRPISGIVKRIYAVGFPSIIMQMTGSVMSLAFNAILLSFTETAVAVFGVYFKVQGFFFMPVFGLNNAIVSIIAYNFGARKPERIIKTTRLSVCYAVAMLTIGFLVFQFMPGTLLEFFNASDEMLEIGTTAFRYISPSFLIAGFVIVFSSVFQALGKGFLSMMISLIRQLVCLVPAAYLLSLTGNLDLIWLSFPIAEVFAGLLAVIYFTRVYRKVILPLKERPEQIHS
jgi:putative MATE family efflux protein